MAKILRAIKNQLMKGKTKTSTQHGPTWANPTAMAANLVDANFFYADDYFKDKAARTKKEHAKGFKVMS